MGARSAKGNGGLVRHFDGVMVVYKYHRCIVCRTGFKKDVFSLFKTGLSHLVCEMNGNRFLN